jgi:hypothetical protein
MSDFCYCNWDTEPAFYSRGKAWVFRDGKWVETNGASVGMEARPMSEEAFSRKFGALPTPPMIAFQRAWDSSKDCESELHDQLRAFYNPAFEESSSEFKALWGDCGNES